MTLFGAPRPGWYNAVDDTCLAREDARKPIYTLASDECAALDRRRMALGDAKGGPTRGVAAGANRVGRKRGFVRKPFVPYVPGPKTPEPNKDSRGVPCAGVCD